MRTAGFVLVGGRSSRMGQDKARLQIGSDLLVESIAEKIARAASRVALIGPPERYKDLAIECLPDLRPGLGPLAGIEAALSAGYGEFNLIAGCDMPNLAPEWLQKLVRTARCSDMRCVVTRDALGKIHPLCAVYRSDCLPLVRRALDAGRLKLVDLIEDLQALEICTADVIANLNTPEQLAAHGERQPLH